MSDKKFFAQITLISRPKEVITTQSISHADIEEFSKNLNRAGVEHLRLTDYAGVTTIVYTRDISTITIHEE